MNNQKACWGITVNDDWNSEQQPHPLKKPFENTFFFEVKIQLKFTETFFLKDFALRSVCYFKYLNDISMRKVTYSITAFTGRWGRKVYHRINVFLLHFTSNEGAKSSSLVAALPASPLVSLLCMLWLRPQAKEKIENSYKSEYSSISKLALGAQRKIKFEGT